MTVLIFEVIEELKTTIEYSYITNRRKEAKYGDEYDEKNDWFNRRYSANYFSFLLSESF